MVKRAGPPGRTPRPRGKVWAVRLTESETQAEELAAIYRAEGCTVRTHARCLHVDGGAVRVWAFVIVARRTAKP